MKKLLAILAALGMSATATSSVVACGQLSVDKVDESAERDIPLATTQIRIGRNDQFDFADYVNLSKTDPEAYARMQILPLNTKEFKYSQTHEEADTKDTWVNANAGIRYSKLTKDGRTIWIFDTLEAHTEFFITLQISAPGYKTVLLSIIGDFSLPTQN